MSIPIFPDPADAAAGAAELAHNAAHGNTMALWQRAQAALANNSAFIANAAGASFPLTIAEQQALVAQVVALSRQVNALAHLVMGTVSDISDT